MSEHAALWLKVLEGVCDYISASVCVCAVLPVQHTFGRC